MNLPLSKKVLLSSAPVAGPAIVAIVCRVLLFIYRRETGCGLRLGKSLQCQAAEAVEQNRFDHIIVRLSFF